ncbi:MAG: hypothetical protein AAF481_14585 [Acidobacteriota bacterium]
MNAEGCRLAVVFAQHDRDKYPRSLLRLLGVLGEIPTLETTIVVVDNLNAGDWSHAVSNNLFHIGGDNGAWEFSAFERGLEWLDGQNKQADVYLFATDALLAYGEDFLALVDGEVLEASHQLGACIGWIDSFMEPCRILDFSYDSWIRTSLVFVPQPVLHKVRPLAWPLRHEQFFGSGFAQPFLPDAPISANLQKLLLEWLTHNVIAESQLEETWHSRFYLAPETFERFRDKVMAILREHLLSARLHALGVPCFDYRAIRKAGGIEACDLLGSSAGQAWQWLGWMQMDSATPRRPLGAVGSRVEAPTFVLMIGAEDGELSRGLCEEVLPLVLQRHSRSRFLVFGHSIPGPVRELHCQGNVLVAKDGEAPQERLDHATALLALPSGGGVTEAIERGVPIISADLALGERRGEPGIHYLSASNHWQVATACCRLIEESELRPALAEAARELLAEPVGT